MKRFLSLLAVGAVSVAMANDAQAQARDFAAQRFIMDDGLGRRMWLEAESPMDQTGIRYRFPSFPAVIAADVVVTEGNQTINGQITFTQEAIFNTGANPDLYIGEDAIRRVVAGNIAINPGNGFLLTTNGGFSQTGAANQNTFQGNVDAQNGLDVTGALLTANAGATLTGLVNINNTGTGSTNIGNTAGNSATTIGVGGTGNLVLNGIVADAAPTQMVTLTNSPNNQVRVSNLANMALEGIVYSAGAFRLGSTLTSGPGSNPFLTNRNVNLDASNLSYTANNGAQTPLQIVGGATSRVVINATGAGENDINGNTNITGATLDVLSTTANINAGANSNATNINTGANTGSVSIGALGVTSVAVLGPTNINVNNNTGDAVNINTGTSTGATTVGNTNAAFAATGTTSAVTGATSATLTATAGTATVSATGVGNDVAITANDEVNVSSTTTNVNTGTGNVNVGNLAGTNTVLGATNINVNNNTGDAVNINTGTATGATSIGGTAGGDVTITVDDNTTDLVLQGIIAEVAPTQWLTLNGSNEVRTKAIVGTANEGVSWDLVQGRYELGAENNTDVPFANNRNINLSTFTLNINNAAPAPIATFNGNTSAINLNTAGSGSTTIGNATGTFAASGVTAAVTGGTSATLTSAGTTTVASTGGAGDVVVNATDAVDVNATGAVTIDGATITATATGAFSAVGSTANLESTTGNVTINADGGATDIMTTGDILPTVDNTWNLGSATNRYVGVYATPSSFHTVGTAGELGGTARDWTMGIVTAGPETGFLRFGEATVGNSAIVTVSPTGDLLADGTVTGATGLTATNGDLNLQGPTPNIDIDNGAQLRLRTGGTTKVTFTDTFGGLDISVAGNVQGGDAQFNNYDNAAASWRYISSAGNTGRFTSIALTPDNSSDPVDLTLSQTAITRTGNIAINPGAGNDITTNGGITSAENVTISSGGLNVTGNTDLNNDLNVDGNTTLNGNVTLGNGGDVITLDANAATNATLAENALTTNSASTTLFNLENAGTGNMNVGINTLTPAGTLANTSVNNLIVGTADGIASDGLNWAANQNGFVQILTNNANNASAHGLGIEVTNASAFPLIVGSTANLHFAVQGNGNTQISPAIGNVNLGNAAGTNTVLGATNVDGNTTINDGANAFTTSIATSGNTGAVAIGNNATPSITVLGPTNINVNNNTGDAVNINTGTSTGATTVGNTNAAFAATGTTSAVTGATSATLTATAGTATVSATGVGNDVAITANDEVNVSSTTTNVNTGTGNVNVGNLAGTNTVLGATNINVNNNTGDAVNINTGTATGATSIGGTAGGNVTITVDDNTTDLRLVGIIDDASPTHMLTKVNGTNEVRATDLSGTALEGVVFSGGAYRLGGPTDADNPFLVDRFVNLDASEITFTTAAGANDVVVIGGNASPTVDIVAATDIDGTTRINEDAGANTRINAGTSNGSVTIGNSTNGGDIDLVTSGNNDISASTATGDIVLNSGATVDIDATGAVTIDGATVTATATTGLFSAVGVGANLQSSNGDVTIVANNALADDVIITGDVLPSADETFNLGASMTDRWASVYTTGMSLHLQTLPGDGGGAYTLTRDFGVGVNTAGAYTINEAGGGNGLFTIAQNGDATVRENLTVGDGSASTGLVINNAGAADLTVTEAGLSRAGDISVTATGGGDVLVSGDNWSVDATGNLAADGTVTGAGLTSTNGSLTLTGATPSINIDNAASLRVVDASANVLMQMNDVGTSMDVFVTGNVRGGDAQFNNYQNQLNTWTYISSAGAGTFSGVRVSPDFASSADDLTIGQTSIARSGDIAINPGAANDINTDGSLNVAVALDVNGATTLDGAVTLGDAAADAITVNGNATFNGTAAHGANLISGSNFDINGGAIDGTTIGASSAAAGTFTNLAATGTLDADGATTLDGAVTLGDAAADAITVNGAATFNSTASHGANQVSGSNFDIDGGSIDGTTIGANTAAAATFTNLTANGAVDLNTTGTGATNIGTNTNSGSISIGNVSNTPAVNIDADIIGIGTAGAPSSIDLGNSSVGVTRVQGIDIELSSSGGSVDINVATGDPVNFGTGLADFGGDVNIDADLTVVGTGSRFGPAVAADGNYVNINGAAGGAQELNVVGDATVTGTATIANLALTSDLDMNGNDIVEIGTLVFGSGLNTTTLGATLGGNRTYTIPNVNNSDFVMTAGAQSIAGNKSFTGTLTVDVNAQPNAEFRETGVFTNDAGNTQFRFENEGGGFLNASFERNITVDNNATISNNLVVDGNATLGNAAADAVTINGAATFNSTAAHGANLVSGTNFDIDGGAIDGTPIGATTRSTARFTTLDANGNVDLGNAAADVITIAGTSTFTAPATFNSTVDINSGTIDGTVIGGSSAAAGTFTTLTAGGVATFNGAVTFNSTATGSSFDINGGTIDGTVIGGTSAANGTFVNLTTNGTATFNGIAQGSNFDINGGNIDGTVIGATSAAAATVSTLTVNGTSTFTGAATFNGLAQGSNFDINGGSIDGTAIGASSANTGTFTALTATGLFSGNGAVTLGNGDADIVQVNSTANFLVGSTGLEMSTGVGTNGILTEGGYTRTSGATETFAFSNPGAGVLDVSIDGNLTVGSMTFSGNLDMNGNDIVNVDAITGTGAFSTSGNISTTGTGSITSANGLTVSAGGASITGGINANTGGITNAGAVSGVTTLSGAGANRFADRVNANTLAPQGGDVYRLSNTVLTGTSVFVMTWEDPDNAVPTFVVVGRGSGYVDINIPGGPDANDMINYMVIN